MVSATRASDFSSSRHVSNPSGQKALGEQGLSYLVLCLLVLFVRRWSRGIHILPPERQTVTPEIQDFSGQLNAFNELDSTSDVCPSLQIPKNLQMCACWEYDTHFCYDRLIDVRRGLSHTPPPSVGRGCLLLADVSLCIRKKTLHRTEVLHFPWSQESVWGPLYHPGYRAAGWTMKISRQVSPLGWHPCQPTPVLTGVTRPMSFISSSQHPCESSIRSVEMSTTG